MGLERYSERHVDVIDVFDDCLYVTVGGVFAFDDLDPPSATICEVFNEFLLCVEVVSDRPDEVWFVVFGFMLWA